LLSLYISCIVTTGNAHVCTTYLFSEHWYSHCIIVFWPIYIMFFLLKFVTEFSLRLWRWCWCTSYNVWQPQGRPDINWGMVRTVVLLILYMFVYMYLTVLRPISISVRLAMSRSEADEHTPLVDADVAMDELEVLVSRHQVYIIYYATAWISLLCFNWIIWAINLQRLQPLVKLTWTKININSCNIMYWQKWCQ